MHLKSIQQNKKEKSFKIQRKINLLSLYSCLTRKHATAAFFLASVSVRFQLHCLGLRLQAYSCSKGMLNGKG